LNGPLSLSTTNIVFFVDGYCNDYGDGYTASFRYFGNVPNDTNTTNGSRCQLYIELPDNMLWSEPYTVTAKDNYTDITGKKATIPAGFRVSLKPGEIKIEQGLVVQGPDGSEFVWIPVANINDMVILNGVSAGNHAGQLYTFSNNGATATKSPTTYTANSGTREPDVVTGNSTGDGTLYDGYANYLSHAGYTSTVAMKTALQAEFNNMVASVNYYNGFYVGRYETGDLSKTTVVSKRGNYDLGAIGQTWYMMYRKQKEMYSGVSSVTSGMIWGCQWDHMLKTIYASDNTKNLISSGSWGNFDNVSFIYKGIYGITTKPTNMSIRIPTGSTERNKAYNIYDVAGNVHNWTLTCRDSDIREAGGMSYMDSLGGAASKSRS